MAAVRLFLRATALPHTARSFSQLADQFTYDNNFIYFQPGSGKVKIKEPKQQVQLASQKLGELLGEK